MIQTTPVTAEFIWTFDELKSMMKAAAALPGTSKGKFPVAAFLTYGILVLAIAVPIIKNLEGRNIPSVSVLLNNQYPIGLFILLVAVFWGTFSLIQRQNLKQAFLKDLDANKRVSVTFKPDELVIAGEAAETRLKWESLVEARRTSKGFCFFRAPQMGFWVPFHAFKSTADIEAVSELASRLAPKYTIT
jgi:hypothetical protein